MATEIYQGEDKTLTISPGADLTSYTEIEFIIDSPRQIKKTLSGGGIGSVTATQFNVDIDAADTARVSPGEYKYQVRATNGSGDKFHSKLTPNYVRILHSSFENPTGGNDYS